LITTPVPSTLAEADDATPMRGAAKSAPPRIVARAAFTDLVADFDMDLLELADHRDSAMVGALP
jgi:hypothetical protein